LDGEEYLPVYGGEAVYLGKEVVSRVRSGGYGYTLKRNIFYAYLPLALAKIGTRLVVDVFDAVHPAEVAPSVLLDPKGEKLRA
jgi:4-methylaminobutanoate oxidase (formaldehyde-forming)